MKQYYQLINTITNKTEYWSGDSTHSSHLLKFGKLILPLGTHKPKNVSRETIKQF